MKKSSLTLISILFAVVLSALTVSAAAYAREAAPTSAVIPETSEQYYALYFPVDVDFDGERFAILENDENDSTNNRLSVYDGGAYTEYDFSSYDATQIRFFNGKILFLSNSRIYLYDNVATDTGMVASTCFSVYGDKILTNTSSGIDVYSYTAADGFTRDSSVALGFSPEALVLSDENTAYYFYNKNIYAYDVAANMSAILCEYSGDARYCLFKDGFVYYTVESGIFRCDVSSSRVSRLNLTPSAYDVQGIAFNLENELLAAYKGEKTVRKIDLSAADKDKDNFTLYAITTNGDVIGRLSPAPTDMFYSDGDLYILDGKTLKIRLSDDPVGKKYQLAPFVSEGSEITALAVNGKKILLNETLTGGDTKLILLEYDGSSLTKTKENAEFTSVTALTVYENEFYFINNRTNVSKQYAEVNRLIETEDGFAAEQITSPLGTGWKLSFDVFGTAYVALSVGGTDNLYISDGEITIPLSAPINDLFVDFGGNVYFIDGSESVKRFNGETVEDYPLTLWQNAPADKTIVAIENVPQEKQVYLLYNGYLLKCEDSLDIALPSEITIPEDHALTFNASPTLVTVAEGKKLFAVSPVKGETDYFDYYGYSAKQGDGKYLLLSEFSDYALLADGDGAYIVRSRDVLESSPLNVSQTQEELFITNDCNAYLIPVLTDEYRSLDLDKNEQVKITARLTFNGREYAVIEKEGENGYIACAYLKPSVADAATPNEYKKATVGRRGATLYSNEALTDNVAELSYGDAVYITEETDEYYRVVYGDGFAYVAKTDIVSKTYYSVRNLIVLTLLFVAITATVVFLVRSRVFRKKDN